jgi:hypothetical protein
MENGKKPAFQTAIGMSNSEMENMGLTKREYFAGLAMKGLLSSNMEGMSIGRIDVQLFAETSVLMSDLLLAELEKTKQQKQ